MIESSVSLFYCKSKGFLDASMHLVGSLSTKYSKTKCKSQKRADAGVHLAGKMSTKRKVLKTLTHRVRLAKEMNTVTKERLMQVCI